MSRASRHENAAVVARNAPWLRDSGKTGQTMAQLAKVDAKSGKVLKTCILYLVMTFEFHGWIDIREQRIGTEAAQIQARTGDSGQRGPSV